MLISPTTASQKTGSEHIFALQSNNQKLVSDKFSNEGRLTIYLEHIFIEICKFLPYGLILSQLHLKYHFLLLNA